MLSCKEVTRLVASEALERETWARRVQVRLHLLYCVHCRRYVRELKLLARAARRSIEPMEPDRIETLSGRIRQTMSRNPEAPNGNDVTQA
jgi:hypothetical protein